MSTMSTRAIDQTGRHEIDNEQNKDSLLRVNNLRTYFPVKRGLLRKTVGYVKAVDDVSFHIAQKETLGLVGESGCGKSTVGRTILRLIPATSGDVIFDNQPVFNVDRRQMKRLRRQMQIIFQDPVGSLNPRMTIGRIISEPIQVHGLAKGSELNERVADLLRRVGMEPDHARRYPHEFSGGQRQRIGIARALALQPRFIVCDEPVSALDVSIQSQILNLLSDLQDEFGLSYLFIAHNLAVVEHFCDRVAVMYLGRIVELADRDELYENPMHPYTRALLSAAPNPDPSVKKKRIMLLGDVPSPISLFKDEPSGRKTAVALESDAAIAEKEAIVTSDEEITYVTRTSLLDRPSLVEVPDRPGHFVSRTEA